MRRIQLKLKSCFSFCFIVFNKFWNMNKWKWLIGKTFVLSLAEWTLPGKERFRKALRSLPRELWTRTSSDNIIKTSFINNSRCDRKVVFEWLYFYHLMIIFEYDIRRDILRMILFIWKLFLSFTFLNFYKVSSQYTYILKF